MMAPVNESSCDEGTAPDGMPSADALPVFERLKAGLSSAGVLFTHTHHEPVYTSAEAAAIRGVSLHSGAKALILKGKDDFFMAVLPADLSLDSGRLRKAIGTKRLRFASKDEVLEMTGLTPGSIPPFGSLFGLATVCDERLSDNERINFNAGSHRDSLQISYDNYVAYENPLVVVCAKHVETDETP
jgi:Ala-tRNA(Pro) deacylase